MRYRSMVALGSSFAAGPGLLPVADQRAARSLINYPHLLAAQLGATLTDATVSGATTNGILRGTGRSPLLRRDPQIDAVEDRTDLVTITAGGNDLGYLGGIIGTALLQQLWRRRGTRPLARRTRAARPLSAPSTEKIVQATDGLASIVEVVRRRAPRARIVLVDSLPIFTAETVTGPAVPFRASEIVHFKGVAETLSRVFADAAVRTGADLVPASNFSAGHGVGSASAWVFGLRPGIRLGSSFHPNAEGMAAIATRVADYLATDQQ